MKKISLMALALVSAASMSAQVTLVKEAEKAFKGADTYPAFQEAVTLITPAFTNDETKSDAKTFWIPGKQAFKIYDDMLVNKQLGKQVSDLDMSLVLLDGLNYGFKALDVDTVIDAKGKVKTKLSKEITSLIGGHHSDFVSAGSVIWDQQKYPEAYQAFTAYATLPGNPRLGSSAPKALADTMAAQIDYYRGLAAWQANMLPEAAQAFEDMMALGYDDISAYDYAYSVAYQLNDPEKMLKYSQIAYDKWGAQKPEFLQRIIQYYINAKDYNTALGILKDAIAKNPNDANFYYLYGVLTDDQGNKEEAMNYFKKAVELGPDNAMVNFSYGTAILQKWEKMADEAANLSTPEYNKLRVETMDPMLKEAASYLEKAYSLDEDNMRNALTNLKIIYYNLNDGENLKRVETLLL